jgi:apolipoprotein D and lipocalin family protein
MDNKDSPTIVEYIATKYGLRLDTKSSLRSNADELIAHLMQYTGKLDSNLVSTSQQNTLGSVPPSISRNINPVLVQDFDIKRYMGLWYEIARIPQPFDQGSAWATAEYRIIDNSTIGVVNTAYNQNGTTRGSITGTAEILDPATPAALYVSFPTGQPRSLPDKIHANYLIHDTDYVLFSIVGSYDGSNLYVLCRKRTMTQSNYNVIIDYVEHLGYNINRIQVNYKAVAETPII